MRNKKRALEIVGFIILVVLLIVMYGFFTDTGKMHNVFERKSKVFYIDSNDGDDNNDGLSESGAWKTLCKIGQHIFVPGDTIKFKRGSNFNTTLHVSQSGLPNKYIVLTDYGNKDMPAPAFTNKQFNPDKDFYGNCIRLKGSYILVENLYFYETVAELSGNIRFLKMWELGAIYIDKNATHCIIKNNELFDCGVGIKSYGEHALITHNYIHDCNRVLKEWSWGPLAIWLGGDHQEVSFNKICNYRAIDSRINWGANSYGDGADGGAIEIDDGRFPKSHIEIHHNFTRDNQGFIEVTWTDVVQNPPYSNFLIHHNISDDYQQFIALWCGEDCKIDNNTVIRRKSNVCDWGVFNITQTNSNNYVRNNLVVVENDIIIFPGGKQATKNANSIISNNLFFIASGSMVMGQEGPGDNAIFSNPQLINYHGQEADDFKIKSNSPARRAGLNLGYSMDYEGKKIPKSIKTDIGAFIFSKN
ncbi:hypothetical protein [Marinifilum caeruleilacunae]|uniref:Right handed beta helix domain-containing protein n=1 Tax=Marinifilum caeruleilacunae TaxID=2499076 RepID=A0ABX1X2E6_9BACT|nr:hypothetical protein [Marinifilum caeruleilacunae]NOU62258.1 hypothetical protein [Marinifilum caeruleilacunae]